MRERAFVKQQLAREESLRAAAPPSLLARFRAWLKR